MTFPHTRVIAVVGVLGFVSALDPSTRIHAQQPLDELRTRAEQQHLMAPEASTTQRTSTRPAYLPSTPTPITMCKAAKRLATIKIRSILAIAPLP